MAKQLGAKSRFEGQYGGMNLGGVQDSPIPGSPPTQSSVSTPNPAVAGVSGGPAAGPTGGMSVGNESPGGDTGGSVNASTGFSPAVTGFNSSLAGQGLGFATSMGVPGLSSVTGPAVGQALGAIGGVPGAVTGNVVGGLLGSAAQSGVTNAALGASPNGLTSSISGPTSFANGAALNGFSNAAAQALGVLGISPTTAINALGSAGVPGFGAPTFSTATAPNDGTPFSLANMAPQTTVASLNGPQGTTSPNVGFGVGTMGSTSLGGRGPGANNTGHVAGTPMSLGPTVATTAPSPAQFFSNLFGVRPNAPDPDPDPEGVPQGLVTAPDPTTESDPNEGVNPDTGLTPSPSDGNGPTNGDVGDTSGTPGSGLGSPGDTGGGNGPASGTVGDTSGTAGSGLGSPGDTGGGDGPGDGGGGVGGGTGSGGGVGGDGGMKRGGKIQRPSAKRLSDKLKAGAKLTKGDNNPETDDVPVRLTKGEFVVDKDSTDKYEPLLRKINAEEPRRGGMNVGGFGRR